jgi:hypothetical protein
VKTITEKLELVKLECLECGSPLPDIPSRDNLVKCVQCGTIYCDVVDAEPEVVEKIVEKVVEKEVVKEIPVPVKVPVPCHKETPKRPVIDWYKPMKKHRDYRKEIFVPIFINTYDLLLLNGIYVYLPFSIGLEI